MLSTIVILFSQLPLKVSQSPKFNTELLVWNCILSHAVYPGRYIYVANPIMSVNGSSEDGNCSLIATLCNEPTTSVLQDGIIPTLTRLDGDMWASQLLTINTDSPTTDITTLKLHQVMLGCRELRW